MPGLFDPSGPGGPGGRGLLGALSNFFANAGAGAESPTAYLQNIQQQRALGADFANLAQSYNPQSALYFTNHPDVLHKLLEPQKLEPGGSLVQPYPIPGMGGGAPQSQAQPQQPSGGEQQPATAAPNTIATNTNGIMDPASIRNAVERAIAGDDSAMKQMGGGMGPLGKLNLAAYNKDLTAVMKERGITPQMLSAAKAKFPAYEQQLKRLGTIEANMGTARMEFEPIWQGFKQAMAQVNGQFPTWSALKQFILKHAGDPRVAPLAQYTQALENVYGRAISTNPAGPTVHDKTKSEQSFNTYWNSGSLDAIEKALRTEMDAAKNSIPKMRNVADVEQGLGRVAPSQLLAQARDAIRRGAPRDKVKDALAEQGFKADGL